MSKAFGDKFFIFCGADTFTLRYLLLGCKGVLTATAAMLPKEHVTLLSMVKKGDIEGARGYYNEAISAWNDIGFYDMSTWQAVHKIASSAHGDHKVCKSFASSSSSSPTSGRRGKVVSKTLWEDEVREVLRRLSFCHWGPNKSEER